MNSRDPSVVPRSPPSIGVLLFLLRLHHRHPPPWVSPTLTCASLPTHQPLLHHPGFIAAKILIIPRSSSPRGYHTPALPGPPPPLRVSASASLALLVSPTFGTPRPPLRLSFSPLPSPLHVLLPAFPWSPPPPALHILLPTNLSASLPPPSLHILLPAFPQLPYLRPPLLCLLPARLSTNPQPLSLHILLSANPWLPNLQPPLLCSHAEC